MNPSLLFIATIAAVIAASVAYPQASSSSSSSSSNSSEDSETLGERIGDLENIGQQFFNHIPQWQFPGFPSLNPGHPRPPHGFGIGVIHRPRPTSTAAPSTASDGSADTEAATTEAAESTPTGLVCRGSQSDRSINR
uniref:Putative secreted protein n=1 Tax=Anopheles nuneztovari TaxID=30067 RepID=A0A2M3YWN3_9DIPT